MANQKTTQLAELTSVDSADILYIVDDPTGTPVSKKATVNNVVSAVGLLKAGGAMDDGADIEVGTTTGSKIGTSTSQKIGFWNATPVVQPTTSVSEATFVENSGGTAVNVDSTFGGYTLQQVVQALQDIGILA